jgi:predicted regulator of Ras-like GTPase activity (Roadblock/LC7/MglB family)
MSFKDELEAICNSVPGSRSAIVMSLDGIAVATHQQRAGGVDTESLLIELINPLKQATGVISAATASGLSAMEMATAKGTLLVSLLKEDHFVALYLDPDAVLGQARFAVRLHRSALNKELF